MDTQNSSAVPTRNRTKIFTFIDASAYESTASSRRSTINSHIAKITHQRRKRRPSHNSSLSSLPLGRLTEDQPQGFHVMYCSVCSQGRLSALVPGPCQYVSNENLNKHSISRTNPGTVLAQGNSDPFNSCKTLHIFVKLRVPSYACEEDSADSRKSIVPIKIDATVNYLLDFARSACIPQVIRRNQQWSADKRNKVPHRQPPSCPHEVSQDLCLGYLFLARYAGLAASLNHDRGYNIACMKFKGIASAMLRTRITSGEMSELGRRNDHVKDIGDKPWLSQVCWLIYMLSTVELSARNYREAAIHTRVILNFLYSRDPSTRVVLRLDVLNAISFWDVQRASITLSRPCFDPDRWAADYLRISWDFLVALKAPLRSEAVSEAESANKSKTEPSSAWPFSKLRESRKIARTLPLLPVDATTEEIRLHFSVWNNIYEAKLLNDILDVTKEANDLGTPRAIYLACLYWLRRSMSSESAGPAKIAVAGTTLYDAGPGILQKMNAIFDREKHGSRRSSRLIKNRPIIQRNSPQQSTNNDGSHNDNLKLRLWVLYVAAMVERATIASARPQKFAIEFLVQARRMGYVSWQQVRDEVLKNFLYDEELDPIGDSWFEKVAGVPLRQLQFF